MIKFRKSAEETKVPGETKGVSEKTIEPRKETEMSEENVTKLTADVEIKGTIKFSNVLKIDGKFEG